MKSFFFFFVCIAVINSNAYAVARDTLVGKEGLPVYSVIYRSNAAVVNCYVEYHDFIKEYFNKNVSSYIRVCSDYKFHNKNIQHIYTSQIDSMRIGHDFYMRILAKDSIKGILAKQISSMPLCYEYNLDDYSDLKIKDSLKSVAFGLGAKNEPGSYIIFYLENKYYIMNMLSNKIDLPISNSYVQLTSNDELISLLRRTMPEKSAYIDKLSTYFTMNQLRIFLKKFN